MENQESKSKWDDLARELGAEIRPDEPSSAPPAPADAATESYSHQRSQDKPRPAPPKRAAADWSQLSTELGLPPIEEPAPPPAPARSAPTPEVQDSLTAAGDDERPPRERQAREDRQQRAERPRRDERQGDRAERGRGGVRGQNGGDRGRRDHGRQERRESGSRSQSDRGQNDVGEREDDSQERGRDDRGPRRRRRGGRGRRNRDDRDVDRGGQRSPDRQIESRLDEPRQTPRSFAEEENQYRPAEEYERKSVTLEPEPTTPPAAEEPPAPSAGISLWHKIFGLPSQQAAKSTEETIREDAVEIEETISVRESSWAETESGRYADPSAEIEPGDADVGRGSEEIAPSEESESDERGRRGRRRRGRGRGGRGSDRGGDRRDDRQRPASRAHSSARSGRSLGGDDEFDDLGVEQDEEDADSEVASDSADGLDSDLGPDDALDGDSSERGGEGKGHRSIPSWDEAIGFIVDANMQSRAHRRQSSHSGTRGNSSRGGSSRGGRSRGGRRRNRPSNGSGS